MSSNRRRSRTDRIDVPCPEPVEVTDSRPVIGSGDSDPNASLVETVGEGGQVAAPANAGRRPALRYLNTEDGLWFNHTPDGASRPDALSSGGGFADVAATQTAGTPGRRDGAAPLSAGPVP